MKQKLCRVKIFVIIKVRLKSKSHYVHHFRCNVRIISCFYIGQKEVVPIYGNRTLACAVIYLLKRVSFSIISSNFSTSLTSKIYVSHAKEIQLFTYISRIFKYLSKQYNLFLCLLVFSVIIPSA